LGNIIDFEKVFDSPEAVPWKSFRNSEDSRYVGLTLPRILLRLPYGRDTVPVEEFDFEEVAQGSDHSGFLWGNAAFAWVARVTDAFARNHWCAAIRGVEGGGLVEGLPAYTFTTDDGDVALKCPTEIAITDRKEKALSDAGFVPLVHCKNTDYAAFFSSNSVKERTHFSSSEATASAYFAMQFPYVFAASRFAQYMKCMMRDKIGSFMPREQAEAFLNQWISNYVLPDDNASSKQKAKFPLREARIDIEEVSGTPGKYRAIAFLRPHFQLEDMTSSLRVVVDLPPPARP
jgi:type VI secretion system protein ImpC